MKSNLSKENLEKLLKDSKGTLISTDNGCAIEGNLLHILGSFSVLTHQLSTSIPKEQLLFAFKTGLEEEDNKKFKGSNEIKNKLKEMLKELSEALSKDIEEMLGDDDDE